MYTYRMASSTKMTADSFEPSLERLERRHQALLGKMGKLGLVLRGSIARRMVHCGKQKCRCKATPPMLHGPYYLWTRKVAGKTVTVQLPPEQASFCLQWNRNMHRLDRIVRALQEVGLRAAGIVRGR